MRGRSTCRCCGTQFLHDARDHEDPAPAHRCVAARFQVRPWSLRVSPRRRGIGRPSPAISPTSTTAERISPSGTWSCRITSNATYPVLDWLAEHMPEVPINIMDQYHPDNFCDPRAAKYRRNTPSFPPPRRRGIAQRLPPRASLGIGSRRSLSRSTRPNHGRIGALIDRPVACGCPLAQDQPLPTSPFAAASGETTELSAPSAWRGREFSPNIAVIWRQVEGGRARPLLIGRSSRDELHWNELAARPL